MGFTLRHASSVSILILGLVSACASTGDATTVETDGGVGGGGDANVAADTGTHDSGTANHDSATADTGGGMVCMANCTSDSECQSSCPPAPNNGVNCCDIGSGVCFASSQSTCPMSGADSGMD